MTDDVVAKLERYLKNDKTMGDMIVGSGLGPALATEIRRQTEMIQRARDEIVALRSHVMREAEAIRNEALEEAARVCDRLGLGVLDDGAAAIRALKKQ